MTDEEIELLLFEAYVASLFPMSIADVEAIEKDLEENPVEIPFSLRDPAEVLARIEKRSPNKNKGLLPRKVST